ncbi:MAG: hypothetical protein ABI472_21030 [Ginsengibacter sp.]
MRSSLIKRRYTSAYLQRLLLNSLPACECAWFNSIITSEKLHPEIEMRAPYTLATMDPAVPASLPPLVYKKLKATW